MPACVIPRSTARSIIKTTSSRRWAAAAHSSITITTAGWTVAGLLRKLRPGDPDILYPAYRIYSTMVDEAVLSLAMDAPKSAGLHQVQAHELARQGDIAGAIGPYREALKLEPHLPDLHIEFAEMLAATQDLEGAIQEYDAALAENPYDAKADCRLGELALKRSEFKTAADYFTRSLRLQPNDVDASPGDGVSGRRAAR